MLSVVYKHKNSYSRLLAFLGSAFRIGHCDGKLRYPICPQLEHFGGFLFGVASRSGCVSQVGTSAAVSTDCSTCATEAESTGTTVISATTDSGCGAGHNSSLCLSGTNCLISYNYDCFFWKRPNDGNTAGRLLLLYSPRLPVWSSLGRIRVFLANNNIRLLTGKLKHMIFLHTWDGVKVCKFIMPVVHGHILPFPIDGSRNDRVQYGRLPGTLFSVCWRWAWSAAEIFFENAPCIVWRKFCVPQQENGALSSCVDPTRLANRDKTTQTGSCSARRSCQHSEQLPLLLTQDFQSRNGSLK